MTTCWLRPPRISKSNSLGLSERLRRPYSVSVYTLSCRVLLTPYSLACSIREQRQSPTTCHDGPSVYHRPPSLSDPLSDLSLFYAVSISRCDSAVASAEGIGERNLSSTVSVHVSLPLVPDDPFTMSSPLAMHGNPGQLTSPLTEFHGSLFRFADDTFDNPFLAGDFSDVNVSQLGVLSLANPSTNYGREVRPFSESLIPYQTSLSPTSAVLLPPSMSSCEALAGLAVILPSEPTLRLAACFPAE